MCPIALGGHKIALDLIPRWKASHIGGVVRHEVLFALCTSHVDSNKSLRPGCGVHKLPLSNGVAINEARLAKGAPPVQWTIDNQVQLSSRGLQSNTNRSQLFDGGGLEVTLVKFRRYRSSRNWKRGLQGVSNTQ